MRFFLKSRVRIKVKKPGIIFLVFDYFILDAPMRDSGERPRESKLILA